MGIVKGKLELKVSLPEGMTKQEFEEQFLKIGNVIKREDKNGNVIDLKIDSVNSVKWDS